ncbi:hypothetical protein GCM10010440_30390 [Kitasatospora cinereorecta]
MSTDRPVMLRMGGGTPPGPPPIRIAPPEGGDESPDGRWIPPCPPSARLREHPTAEPGPAAAPPNRTARRPPTSEPPDPW